VYASVRRLVPFYSDEGAAKRRELSAASYNPSGVRMLQRTLSTYKLSMILDTIR